jgi:hypothetical protein
LLAPFLKAVDRGVPVNVRSGSGAALRDRQQAARRPRLEEFSSESRADAQRNCVEFAVGRVSLGPRTVPFLHSLAMTGTGRSNSLKFTGDASARRSLGDAANAEPALQFCARSLDRRRAELFAAGRASPHFDS